MSAIQITKENFAEVAQSGKTVLLDFWATWCSPCRMMLPIVDQIANERPDVIVGKINVDEEPDIAKQFKVVSIPTFYIIKDGKVAEGIRGAQPKAKLIKMLD